MRILLLLSLLISICLCYDGDDGRRRADGRVRSAKHRTNRMRMVVKRLSTLMPTTTTSGAVLQAGYNDEKYIKNIVNVTVNVGDNVRFKCAIDVNYENNAGVIWVQGKLGNVLTLNNNRITEDQRFDISQPFDKYNQNFDLALNNVQFTDENEYSCETSTFLNNKESITVHNLVYLSVTQPPSFIEEKTSDTTISVHEFTNLTLNCFASGIPEPTIKWYRLNQERNTVQDLSYESNTLELTNLTHRNRSIYECIASNGVQPSISKKFTITVLYAPLVHPVKPHIHHSLGHSASIGCIIKSNPQSQVSWFKNDKPIVLTQQDVKYEIITFNQINQTVTYLKINNLQNSDFGNYMCEAVNSIGENSKTIQLLEAKSYNYHRPDDTVVAPVTTTQSSSEQPSVETYRKSNVNEEFVNTDEAKAAANQRLRKLNRTQTDYKVKTNFIKNPSSSELYNQNASSGPTNLSGILNVAILVIAALAAL